MHTGPDLYRGSGIANFAPEGRPAPLEWGSILKVIIPLAGKGTRLRPHTYTTPKPLLRVGGKPVMSYILDDLAELGVDEIIFITGYLKQNIEQYVAQAYPQFKVQYVEQPVQ